MTEDQSPAKKRSSRTQVLEAICALHEMGVTDIDTPAIMRATGLPRLTVGDSLKDIKGRGEIFQPRKAIYEPLFKHPPSQAISVTWLEHGSVKIEKGDQVMELTPNEWQHGLAPLAAGSSARNAVMEHVMKAERLAAMVEFMQAKIESLEAKSAGKSGQLVLGV